jgi:nifR3 family TIM-barrel protein
VEQGAALTFTALVSSEALVRGGLKSAHDLLLRAPNEEGYVVQLFGADAGVMADAAAMLAPCRPVMLDLNAGCPVPKVVKAGAGAALMRESARLAAIVRALVDASRSHLGGIPVSVKMRSGWDAASINYAECAAAAVDAGAALVSLHPRTRAQGYGGSSDWRHIASLAAALPVPVAGSGDLYTAEDAERMLAQTGCAAVMFARGALGNPFVFAAARARLAGAAYTPPSDTERLDTALRQLRLLAADIGEKSACLEMRKVFCAYTKGLPDGAALRNRLVRASSIAEYCATLNEQLAMKDVS